VTWRVLLCHNSYTVLGGAEVFYRDLGRLLTDNGHDVMFFSARDGSEEAVRGYEYFPSAADYSSGSITRRALALPKMIYNLDAKQSMARLIRDFKPQLIHVCAIYVKLTPSILDAARAAGVPVVMSCNDYKHICPNYKLFHHGRVCEECKGGRFYRAIANRCCHDSLAYSIASSVESYAHGLMDIYRRNVHTFLFASHFMARKTEEFWGKGAFRWEILRNPFDAGRVVASQEVGDYALYFGRLIDEKGIDVLLGAAALAPEVPLLVVGDGPDRARLESQARRMRLPQVRFLGPKWGAELDPLLRHCRFVVVPSLWHENFPYVILQAFACGRPVVGAARGGIPELVEDGVRGLIYEAADGEALASAMRCLMRDAGAARRMGAQAKSYVDAEFNDARIYARLMQIYGQVIR
jgi:glycosyltransferase involved in cell wall biosynthesis